MGPILRINNAKQFYYLLVSVVHVQPYSKQGDFLRPNVMAVPLVS